MAERRTIRIDLRSLQGIFPAYLWLQALHAADAPAHVSCRLVYVPEGFLILGRCDACGGRHEGLLDIRNAFVQGDVEKAANLIPKVLGRTEALPQGALGEQIGGVLRTALDDTLRSWTREHLECEVDPREYHMPHTVLEHVYHLLGEAERGRETPETLTRGVSLLQTEGPPYFVALSSEDEGEKRSEAAWEEEMARRQFGVREFIRARGLDMVASVLFSEATLTVEDDQNPSAPPELKPALLVAVTTTTFGRLGVCEALGERRYGTLHWSPLLTPVPFLDGLFGMTDLYPQSPEEKARGLGQEDAAP